VKAARFVTPSGSVTLKADNEESAKEFASHFSLSVLPEAERCPIAWLQVFAGTNPVKVGTNPTDEGVTNA
jgi:hypothetical protein